METEATIVQPKLLLLTSPEELTRLAHRAEYAGRISKNSIDKMTDEFNQKFLSEKILAPKHESVLEHMYMHATFVTDRATCMQILRHRFISPTMESQRYCRYVTDDDYARNAIGFIIPAELKDGPWEAREMLKTSFQHTADDYSDMLKYGAKPQAARAVLPNATAARLTITANLREWKNIIRLRSKADAQLDVRLFAHALYHKFVDSGLGWLVDDIEIDNHLGKSYILKEDLPLCEYVVDAQGNLILPRIKELLKYTTPYNEN